MTPRPPQTREACSPLDSAQGVGWDWSGGRDRRTLAMGCIKPANDEEQFWQAVRLIELRERKAPRAATAPPPVQLPPGMAGCAPDNWICLVVTRRGTDP